MVVTSGLLYAIVPSGPPMPCGCNLVIGTSTVPRVFCSPTHTKSCRKTPLCNYAEVHDDDLFMDNGWDDIRVSATNIPVS